MQKFSSLLLNMMQILQGCIQLHIQLAQQVSETFPLVRNTGLLSVLVPYFPLLVEIIWELGQQVWVWFDLNPGLNILQVAIYYVKWPNNKFVIFVGVLFPVRLWISGQLHLSIGWTPKEHYILCDLVLLITE
jgi:hypothetical protein